MQIVAHCPAAGKRPGWSEVQPGERTGRGAVKASAPQARIRQIASTFPDRLGRQAVKPWQLHETSTRPKMPR
jgi:hypothetical protein